MPRRQGRSRILLAGGLIALAAAVIAALLRRRETPGAPRPRGANRPLRASSRYRRGYLTGARFAPDGQTIVYSAAWDGKPSEIFDDASRTAPNRGRSAFSAGILAVSSSGEMAISLGCEDRWDPCFGTLARAPLAGGAPRELLEDVSSADWRPDGKELAAIHVVDGRYRIEYPARKGPLQDGGVPHRSPDFPGGRLGGLPRAPQPRQPQGSRLRRRPRRDIEAKLTGEWSAVDSTLWSPGRRGSLLRREVARPHSGDQGRRLCRARFGRPPGCRRWMTSRATGWFSAAFSRTSAPTFSR